MSPVNDINWGLDVYRIVAFPLNDDGSLQAVDEVPYEGIEFAGPKSFEVNYGAARAIANVSQGRVNDTIHLPSIEPKTGVIHCSYDKQSLNALLSGVAKSVTVGETTAVHYGTDKQGQEPMVGLLLSQLVTHDADGLVAWKNYVVPRATVVPDPHAFTENALDKVYNITFSSATRELWGELLTLAAHGCTQSTMTDINSAGRLNIVAWVGDNIVTSFNFPTSKNPSDSTHLSVFQFDTGLEVTGTYAVDPSTGIGSFTPTVLLAAGKQLIAVYELD